MKAIKITQELKDQNAKYRIDWISKPIGEIVKASFPSSFYVTQPVSGGYGTRTDLHDADGWKQPVTPPYDSKIEKLGELEEVGEDFVYKVISKSQQEIENELMSNNSSERRTLIQEITEHQIIEDAQALPDEKALDMQPLYPLWNEFAEEYRFEPPMKVQDFVDSELILFKAIQPNDKRENTQPKLFPAGWSKIEYSGGIEVWMQPIGGDGKYPYLDPDTGQPYKVSHDGFIWENDFEDGLNVWEPPTLWIKGDAI